MGNIIVTCEFGVVHRKANCRCMDTHTERRQIKCNVPEQHKMQQFVDEVETGEKVLKSLHERLTETVDSYFGGNGFIMPIVKKSLVDSLEKAVSEWLIEAGAVVAAKEIKE